MEATTHYAFEQPPLSVVLANSLKLNCEQYHRGDITRQEWDDTQVALWRYAESHGIAPAVRSLVTPR